MSFGNALSFPFKDPQWFKKLIIPGLLGMIPFFGPLFPMGYSLSIARKMIENGTSALPVFDFGREFKRGFMLLVVGLGYALPVILVFFIMSLGLVIYGVLSSQSGNMDSSAFGILTMQSCFGILAAGYGLFIAFFTPAAIANLLANGERLGEAFRFGKIWGAILTALPSYLFLFLGAILINLLAASGSILCGIGLILTVPYAMAVYGHMLGQAYRCAHSD